MLSYIQDTEYKVYDLNFIYQASLMIMFNDSIDLFSKKDEILPVLKLAADKVETLENNEVEAYFKKYGMLYLTKHSVFVYIPGDKYVSIHNFDFCFSILDTIIRIVNSKSYGITVSKGNKFTILHDINNEDEWDVFLSSIVSPSYLSASSKKDNNKRFYVLTQNDRFTVSAESTWGKEKEGNGNSVFINLVGCLFNCEGNPKSLSNIVYSIDKDVYNVWHWTINADVLSAMEGGNRK